MQFDGGADPTVAAAVLLLGVLFGSQVALPAPSEAAGTPGTLTCVSTISGVTYTVVATMGGVLQIGGFEPDTLTGNCTMSGDNTGTIDVEAGLTSLIASDGSQNDGTIEFVGDDVAFTGSGTFTNNGSVIDDSPGFTQSVTISDFVNLGTVEAELPSGSTSGPTLDLADGSATSFDNQGTVGAGAGSAVDVWGGTFVLDPTGTVTAGPGSFGVGNGGSMEINGGTVSGGAVQEIEFLGTCANSFTFASAIPGTSSGSIAGSCPVALSGTVPSNWTLEAGGNLEIAPGSVNDGAIQLDGGNLTVERLRDLHQQRDDLGYFDGPGAGHRRGRFRQSRYRAVGAHLDSCWPEGRLLICLTIRGSSPWEVRTR